MASWLSHGRSTSRPTPAPTPRPRLRRRLDRKQGYPYPAVTSTCCASAGPTRATVVDLAAGTGRFAVAAARRFGRVRRRHLTGDGRLRAGAPPPRGLTTLEFVRAGFLRYEHTGPPADGVHTRNGLHQLPDFWKGSRWGGSRGSCAPAGCCGSATWSTTSRPPRPRLCSEWFAGAATDPADGYTAEDYAEHIRTEHSTYRVLLDALLELAGFDIVDVQYQTPAVRRVHLHQDRDPGARPDRSVRWVSHQRPSPMARKSQAAGPPAGVCGVAACVVLVPQQRRHRRARGDEQHQVQRHRGQQPPPGPLDRCQQRARSRRRTPPPPGAAPRSGVQQGRVGIARPG